MTATALVRKSTTRHLVRGVTGLSLAAVLLGFAGAAFARPLTLSPVGAPIPGQGPVGLATITDPKHGTFVIIADFFGNQVRSYGFDRNTGSLTPVDVEPLPNGPSALAVSPGGKFVLATTLGGNDVTSYAIDPVSGALSPVGAVPTGGTGPVNLDVSDDGFAVIANKDSDSLGVVQIDPISGALSPIGAVPVGDGPNDVKVARRNVVVGHANSNDVHLLRLDRFGGLLPISNVPVGARVTGVAVRGRQVAVGTFPGDVLGFNLSRGRLIPTYSHFTNGDITDVTISERGTLFVTGGIPGRVTAFERERPGLREVGTLALPGGLTSRTLATVKGPNQTTWVIVNEFQGNQTQVIAAQPGGGEAGGDGDVD